MVLSTCASHLIAICKTLGTAASTCHLVLILASNFKLLFLHNGCANLYKPLMKIKVLDGAQVTQAKVAPFGHYSVILVFQCCHQTLWISVYEQDFCSTKGNFKCHNI